MDHIEMWSMQGGSLWEGEAPAEPCLRTDATSVGFNFNAPIRRESLYGDSNSPTPRSVPDRAPL